MSDLRPMAFDPTQPLPAWFWRRSFGERAEAGTPRVRVNHGFGDAPVMIEVTHRGGEACGVFEVVHQSARSVSVRFPDQDLMHDVSVFLPE